MYRCLWIVVALLLSCSPVASSAAEKESPVAAYLKKGDLGGGAEAMEARLKQSPDDAESRFSLAIVQLLGGVETLSQSMYRHGLQPGGPRVPFLRLDVPVNRDPEPIDYAKLRKIFERLASDLDTVDKTLRKVDDPEVKVRIPLGLIKLDLDGDGKARDEETFWRLFVSVGGPRVQQAVERPVTPAPVTVPPANSKEERRESAKQKEPPPADPPEVAITEPKKPRELSDEEKAFVVAFDQADVHWFRGYTHVLRALLEAQLAYDGEDFFKHVGHVFFAGARPPYAILKSADNDDDADFSQMASRIADLVAAVHLLKAKPTEPERLTRAHEHLLAMIEQSRACIKLAGKESDNDHEWIPNPDQDSVVPMQVTREQIEIWGEFLDEWQALLEGKKLLPHWNIHNGQGINLKKVFHEPRDFDLVLWLHGAGVAPFLQKGECTDPEKWREMNRAFQGNLFFVALWFN